MKIDEHMDVTAAPARAAATLEYMVIEVRMTWRGEEPKTGAQELSEKLTAAAKDGWRLQRLQFHTLPQGEGYIELVTAYAVMARQGTGSAGADRFCPCHGCPQQ